MQAAHAQLTKGNWLVGGSGSFSSDKQVATSASTNIKSTTVGITPNIGYFIIDKFAVGMNLGFEINKLKAANIPTSSITNYYAGPFLKYYLLQEDELINLFVYGNYNYGVTRGKNYGMVDKSSGYRYSVSGGPVIFFNSSTALELSIGWYHARSIEDKVYTNSIKLGLGFQIHLDN
jgi:hypothetical protein